MKRFLDKQYGRALGGRIYRTLITMVIGALLVAALAVYLVQRAERREAMTWLTVVYYPIPSAMVPKIKVYRIERELCVNKAQKLYADYRALKTQAFCLGG